MTFPRSRSLVCSGSAATAPKPRSRRPYDPGRACTPHAQPKRTCVTSHAALGANRVHLNTQPSHTAPVNHSYAVAVLLRRGPSGVGQVAAEGSDLTLLKHVDPRSGDGSRLCPCSPLDAIPHPWSRLGSLIPRRGLDRTVLRGSQPLHAQERVLRPRQHCLPPAMQRAADLKVVTTGAVAADLPWLSNRPLLPSNPHGAANLDEVNARHPTRGAHRSANPLDRDRPSERATRRCGDTSVSRPPGRPRSHRGICKVLGRTPNQLADDDGPQLGLSSLRVGRCEGEHQKRENSQHHECTHFEPAIRIMY